MAAEVSCFLYRFHFLVLMQVRFPTHERRYAPYRVFQVVVVVDHEVVGAARWADRFDEDASQKKLEYAGRFLAPEDDVTMALHPLVPWHLVDVVHHDDSTGQ